MDAQWLVLQRFISNYVHDQQQGKDICTRARTGSGKTLAYSIPVIQKILANQGHVS